MNKDLTVGKPGKVLLKFCLPLLGSMIFQQLYNIADSLVAGKFLGETALASVGNSYEITLLFLAFAFGCNIGCSVIVGQFFGAGKIKEVKTAIFTTFIAVSVLCAVLMAVGLICCASLLNLINTPESMFEPSSLYLKIYIYGLPFLFIYNVSTGIFSSLGDSITPFCLLAVSSVANIGVDILFVTVGNLGIAGVAWATFLCQGISGSVSFLLLLLRLKKMKTDAPAKIFSWKILLKIAIIAIPSLLQQSFISVGNIIIQGVINSFGKSVIAGYSGAIKLNSFVISSLVTLSSGISSFTSQNIGAGKPDRIHAGWKSGMLISLTIAVPLSILYVFAGKYLLLAFMDDTSGEAMLTGVRFLTIVSPFYSIGVVKLVCDGVLRGSGKMLPFTTTTFTDLILRVVLAVILAPILGTDGIWAAWPIGWGISAALSYLFYMLLVYKAARRKKGVKKVISDT